MSNQAHLLPARLHAAATGIANARAARRGAPAIMNVLDLLPEDVFAAVVDDASAALDAAHAVAPDPGAPSADPQVRRFNLAASVGLDLGAQAVVVIDIARDGTVHSSTWAEGGGGTRSRAIGEWANGLLATQLTAASFQTAFGMGFAGRPTPLTAGQLATLSPTAVAYVERTTIPPDSPEAIARPLDGGDAEALGRALNAGSLLILARDRNARARAVLWAVSAEAAVYDHDAAQAVWRAAARELIAHAPDTDQPFLPVPQPEEPRP